jgi:adenylyl-sulfate kinase
MDLSDNKYGVNMNGDSNNIFAQALKVSRQEREAKYNQKSFTLWLTGLSAAGKSTIAIELDLWLFRNGYHSYVLDGDNTRMGINKDLSFSDSDRKENIRRIAEVSRLFNDAGVIVIAAYVSPFEEDRASARMTIGKNDFIEVFVDASIETCKTRDKKGLYAKAEKGEIENFTGISSRYEAPVAPDIHINTDNYSIDEAVESIITRLKQLNRL